MMQRPDESVVHGSRAGQTAQPRDLPSVDRLLREPAVQALLAEHGHTLVAGEARALLDALRAEVIGGNVLLDDVVLPVLSAKLQERVQECLQLRMRAVLNLTGTVIHTNLGRSLLAEPALQHMLTMMAGPNNLEYDLETGARGDRDSIIEEMLCTLTGAEAATVVNNNAAAVLLTLAARRRKMLPFALSWWGFTFPLGIFVVCSLRLAKLSSIGMIAQIGLLAWLLLLLLWSLALINTVRGVVSGDVFRPHP